MNSNTQSAIKQVCERAAVRINNAYATAYMDVHSQAGPWGTKHDEDVAEMIEQEVLKLFMVMKLKRNE